MIYFYENVRITIKMSRKFIPKGQFNNKPPRMQMVA